MNQRGFTLIEVLVALGITAVALMAGLKATGSLSRNAERQNISMLGQMCAENELIRLRLRRQLPDTGDSPVVAARALHVAAVEAGDPDALVAAADAFEALGAVLLAAEAMKQERLLVNNPCPITQEDARRLYEAAL